MALAEALGAMATEPKLVILSAPENMTDERRTKFTETDEPNSPIIPLTS
jgi:hypothetical protein